MPNLKLMRGSMLIFALLLIGSAHAVKPERGVEREVERSESFWDRWLGHSEKIEYRDAVKSKVKDTYRVKEKSNIGKTQSNRYFSDVERSRITDYYRRDNADKRHNKYKKSKKKQLPPGLQKKLARDGQLPPGWQTKVVRGEVLDGEILRRSELIPEELARHLPTLHDGEVIRRVGNKVVRVLEGNGTIIDVIDLADIVLR
ncbi:MAG: hypothetical protein COB89_07520 [Piscirickettsiaceae bacterium]|nr:MAG: hypothetical protein COB89_07520 [Piscirickettsiaceae bacterium]